MLHPTPKLEKSPILGCLQLLIEYIDRYLLYLEAVSSIGGVRERHAVVTGTHFANLNYGSGRFITKISTNFHVALFFLASVGS